MSLHRSLYYRLVGREVEPIADHDHKALAEEYAKDRHVANSIVGEAHVSTVFLALDHSFTFRTAPVLFETMVFFKGDTGEAQMHDEYMDRYTSYAAALQGHNAIVEKLRLALGVNGSLTKEQPDGKA